MSFLSTTSPLSIASSLSTASSSLTHGLSFKRKPEINPIAFIVENHDFRDENDDSIEEIIQPIRGVWEACQYKIKVNWNSIRNTKAAIIFEEKKITCPVVWHFPLLSQARLKNAVKRRDSPFKVILSENPDTKAKNFTVHVYCAELRMEAESYWQFWNSASLIHEGSAIAKEADWCRQEPDRAERQRFFFRKVLKSKKTIYHDDPDLYPRGPIRAAMILCESGFSFDGQHLEGIKIAKAKIPGIIFRNTFLRSADLRSVHVEQADLYRASLFGCKMAGAHFGLKLTQKLFTAGWHFSLSPDDRWLVFSDPKFATQDQFKMNRHAKARRIQFLELDKGHLDEKRIIKGKTDIVQNFRVDFIANYSDFCVGKNWFAYWTAGKIIILSMESHKEIGSINCKGKCIVHLAISPDEKIIVAVDIQGRLMAWRAVQIKKSVKFSEIPGKFDFPKDTIRKAFFKQEGAKILLVLLANNNQGSPVTIIDTDQMAPVARHSFPEEVIDICVDLNGPVVLIQEKAKLQQWDYRSDVIETLLEALIDLSPIALCSNEAFLFYSVSRVVIQFSIHEKKEISRFEAGRYPIKFLCCNHKGDQLIIVDNTGAINIWEIENLPHPKLILEQQIINASFTPDSKQLLLMSEPQIAIHDVNSGVVLERQCLAAPRPIPELEESFKSAQDVISFIRGMPEAHVRFFIEKLNETSFSSNRPFQVCSISDDLSYLATGSLRYYKEMEMEMEAPQNLVEIWDLKKSTKVCEWRVPVNSNILNFQDLDEIALAVYQPQSISDGIAQIAIRQCAENDPKKLLLAVLTYKEGLSVWEIDIESGSQQKMKENDLGSSASFLLQFKEGYHYDMFFSKSTPNLYMVANGCGELWDNVIKEISIWNYERDEWNENINKISLHADVICFHDRLSIFVADDALKGLIFWDLKTCQEIHKIEEECNFNQLVLSPDGRYLAAIRDAGTSGFVWELNIEDGKMTSRLLWRLPALLNLNKAMIHSAEAIPIEHDLSLRDRDLLKELGVEERMI